MMDHVHTATPKQAFAGAFIPAAGHAKASKKFGDSTNSLAQQGIRLDTENRAENVGLSQIERIE